MEGRRAGEFYPIKDEEKILGRFAAFWTAADRAGDAAKPGGPPDLPGLAELVRAVLASRDWWGEDLNGYFGIGEAVTESLALMLRPGMGEALAGGLDKSESFDKSEGSP
jgi:hypothetical protein